MFRQSLKLLQTKKPPAGLDSETRKKIVKDAIKEHKPGEGLASKAHETNTLFRVTSFELFVKPNMKVAIPGTILFVGCVGFIGYMKFNAEQAVREGTHYVGYTEDGQQTMKVTTGSKWD